MKKRIVLGVAMLALALSLTACKDSRGASDGAQQTGVQTAQTEAASGSGENAGVIAASVEGLKEAIAEQPVLLTSVGQSADYEMVKTMLDKNNIKYEKNGMATSADIKDARTLVLAIGGSSKGLGAAGIDANGELKRVQELVNAAKEQGLIILALHIGGEARRGDLSDKFIEPGFSKADYAIVVADGDKDGLMEGLAGKLGIPIDVVTGMADVVPKLGAAFK